MKSLICSILLAGLAAGCACTGPCKTAEKSNGIIHSVFFTLKHAPGSDAEAAFFAKAEKLAAIPGVQNFQVLQEVSSKNPYAFGFAMEFATQADYDSYNKHPDHVEFVENVWMNEVADFQEVDYVLKR